MMKTKTLLCAGLLAISTIIPLDFTEVMAQGSPQRGCSILKNAIASEINTKAEAYRLSGNAKIDHQDYQGAISDYNRALSIDPNYAKAYVGRGLAKRLMGETYSAIDDYKRAIEINPNYTNAYNNLGNALIGISNSEAIGYLNQAIDLDPKNANAYANRGMARFNRGDYAGAIADYDRSIALDPNHPGVPRTRSDRDWAIRMIQEGEALGQSNRVRNSGRPGR